MYSFLKIHWVVDLKIWLIEKHDVTNPSKIHLELN